MLCYTETNDWKGGNTMNITKRIPVWEAEEYTYKGAGSFIPTISSYLHDDEEERPALIVCPGGGYFCVSPTEGEIVAKKFFAKGYNCFVFSYTTNPTTMYPLLDQPMKDLSRAIRYVRAHAHEFHICVNKVYICGFSAAGHLCASVCDYHQAITDDNPKYQNISNRPDGAILSYPVISSGPKAHQGSFEFLIDQQIYKRTDAEAAELLDKYSLEKHVTEDNPPAFLWHTITDDLVPVENSFLYEAALREKGVKHAMHLYSWGHHGLSLADAEWASRTCFGERYTLDQFVAIKEALEEGTLEMEESLKAGFLSATDNLFAIDAEDQVYPEVMFWPDLADAFFKELEK